MWIDYDGNDVVVGQNIKPGGSRVKYTYFTHPFFTRDSVTSELRSFNYESTTAAVFEGHNFGVCSGDTVKVSIC